MQDASIYLTDSNYDLSASTDDLLAPAPKRRKVEETFPELHQRLMQGDVEAFAAVFANPSHAHKFKVINGTKLIKPQDLSDILDENYPPLTRLLLKESDYFQVFSILAVSPYAPSAKIYAKRFVGILLKHNINFNFSEVIIKLLESQVRYNTNESLKAKTSKFNEVIEAVLPFSFTKSGIERLEKNKETIKKLLKNIFNLISPEMNDLEKVVLLLFKSLKFRNAAGILGEKENISPLIQAIRVNNFELVKAFYQMPLYPMTKREYCEIILFQLKNQHLYDFSYANFGRFSSRDLQDEIIQKIRRNEVGIEILVTLYGEFPERYLDYNDANAYFFKDQLKLLKKGDVSANAKMIRRINQLWKKKPAPLNLTNEDAIIKMRSYFKNSQACLNQRVYSGNQYSRTVPFYPVEFLVRSGDIALLEEFIGYGIDVNFYNQIPALALAISLDADFEFIKKLFLAGASPYLILPNTITPFLDGCRLQNAIEVAVQKNRLDVLELFYQHGVDLNFSKESILLVAAHFKNASAFQFLLEKNISLTSHSGFLISHFDGVLNEPEILKVLVQMDRIREVDYRGQTALHVAISKKNIPATKQLLQAGLDPNLTDILGRNCLSLAIACMSYEIIDILMTMGTTFQVVHESLINAYISKFQNAEIKTKLLSYIERFKNGLVVQKSYFAAFPQEMIQVDEIEPEEQFASLTADLTQVLNVINTADNELPMPEAMLSSSSQLSSSTAQVAETSMVAQNSEISAAPSTASLTGELNTGFNDEFFESLFNTDTNNRENLLSSSNIGSPRTF